MWNHEIDFWTAIDLKIFVQPLDNDEFFFSIETGFISRPTVGGGGKLNSDIEKKWVIIHQLDR